MAMSVLFRSAPGLTGTLAATAMNRVDALRMIQHRAADLGTKVKNGWLRPWVYRQRSRLFRSPVAGSRTIVAKTNSLHLQLVHTGAQRGVLRHTLSQRSRDQ
jgi:hypothetical protein